MTRSSFPTAPDARFKEDVQLQRLWVEFGQGARYRLESPVGDCSAIEIEVVDDLAHGVPYNTDLKLTVALVRDDIETQARAVDDLLISIGEDAGSDPRRQITLVDCVEAMAREDRPTLSPLRRIERLDLRCVNIRLHTQRPDLRILLVHPIIEPGMLDGDDWILEIRFGEHDLVRRIPADRPTLVPPQP